MPSINELLSIVDLSRHGPSIDISYFPNTSQWGAYWSGTPYDMLNKALLVSFYRGVVYPDNRGGDFRVRLVYSDR